MADELLRIEGLQELLKTLNSVAQLKPVTASIKAAAVHLKGVVARYPARKHLTRAEVYGSSFKTDKQRRFFFAALKSGTLDVPYRRGMSDSSETFGRRWTVDFTNNGLRATIGNNASYGPLLMDQEKQTLYAKAAGWKTVQDIFQQEKAGLLDMIGRGFQEALQHGE